MCTFSYYHTLCVQTVKANAQSRQSLDWLPMAMRQVYVLNRCGVRLFSFFLKFIAVPEQPQILLIRHVMCLTFLAMDFTEHSCFMAKYIV